MRTERNIHPAVIGGCLALFMLLWSTSLSAQTVDNWWTGGAGTTNWSDTANWHAGVPGTNHAIRFGYAGDPADVPDAAQNIHIDVAEVVVAHIRFEGDGDRAVTLSGNPLTVRIADGNGPLATALSALYGVNEYRMVRIVNTATAMPTVNANLVMDVDGVVDVRQESMHVPFVIGPLSTVSGTREFRGGGEIRIEGKVSSATRLIAPNLTLAPASATDECMAACDMRTTSTIGFRIEADATVLRIEMYDDGSNFAGEIDVIRGATGDRSLTISQRIFGSDMRTVTLKHDAAAGEGHLTLRLPGMRSDTGSPVIHTTTNSTVEFYRDPAPSTWWHIGWADNAAISGPGRVRLALDVASDTQQVFRRLAHTGGTVVRTGVFELHQASGKAPGALPEVGMLLLETDGAFDLNGFDDTVGGLGGTGTVQLDGASLTVTEGVSPGLSVGTLTLSQGGALVLDGGVSRFEFDDPETHDKVVFTGAADLTLGGTLEVTAPEGFSTIGTGRYTLFELNGGTVTGTFAAIIPPTGMMAMIEIEDNNVVLVLRTGTTILIR